MPRKRVVEGDGTVSFIDDVPTASMPQSAAVSTPAPKLGETDRAAAESERQQAAAAQRAMESEADRQRASARDRQEADENERAESAARLEAEAKAERLRSEAAERAKATEDVAAPGPIPTRPVAVVGEPVDRPLTREAALGEQVKKAKPSEALTFDLATLGPTSTAAKLEKPSGPQPTDTRAAEFVVGLIPVVGTVKGAKDLADAWEGLSTRSKVGNTALLGLSALGDVAMIVPAAGIAIKAVAGSGKIGKVVVTGAVTSGDEAAGLLKTLSKVEQKAGAAEITAADDARHFGQVGKFADAAPANSKIQINIEPTASSVKAAGKIDDALMASGKNFVVEGVIRVDRALLASQVDEAVEAVKASGIKRVKIEAVEHPLSTKATDDLAEAISNANAKHGIKISPDEVKTGFNDAALKADADDVAKAAADFRAKLQAKDIRVTVEKTKIDPDSIKAGSKVEKRVLLEPDAPSGTGRGGVAVRVGPKTDIPTQTRITVPGGAAKAVPVFLIPTPAVGKAIEAPAGPAPRQQPATPEPGQPGQPGTKQPGPKIEPPGKPQPGPAGKPTPTPGPEVKPPTPARGPQPGRPEPEVKPPTPGRQPQPRTPPGVIPEPRRTPPPAPEPSRTPGTTRQPEPGRPPTTITEPKPPPTPVPTAGPMPSTAPLPEPEFQPKPVPSPTPVQRPQPKTAATGQASAARSGASAAGPLPRKGAPVVLRYKSPPGKPIPQQVAFGQGVVESRVFLQSGKRVSGRDLSTAIPNVPTRKPSETFIIERFGKSPIKAPTVISSGVVKAVIDPTAKTITFLPRKKVDLT